MSSPASSETVPPEPSVLPMELVLDILHNAASTSMLCDRAWACSLAHISRYVYRLITPILHRTMVITPKNLDTISLVWDDPRSAHVFASVRRLVITFEPSEHLDLHDDPDGLKRRVHRLFPSVTEIDAPFSMVQALMAAPDFRPLRVALRYNAFSTITTVEHPDALSSVTHLQGCIPESFSGGSPRQWVHDILAMVPSLTHLAFDLINLEPDPEGWEPYVSYGIVQPDGLMEVLETALSLERIQRVVLDVVGERLHVWPIINRVVRRLEDPRLSVWSDERPMETWADKERLFVEDAWAGRDVWTVATDV